jgi:Tfp pilus assembly protein PilF
VTIVAALALAGFIYLPTLKYKLVWDDVALIVENQDLDTGTPLQFLGESFTHWWAKQGLAPDAYYRPLVILGFWAERRIWGQNPSGYHLTNVLLNVGVAVLVGLVLSELFGSLWPALLAGLVFALHPTHVESVAFVSGRTDLMMMLFGLLAFLALLSYRRRPTTLSLALAVGSFALALLCKEAILLLPLIAFMVLYPIGQPRARQRRNWLALGLLAAVALLYLAARALVLRGVSIGWQGATAVQRILLVLNALGRYAFLTLVPFFHRLSYPDLIPFTAFGWPSIVGAVALIGSAGLAIRYRRSSVGLGSAWFLLFILPACNFFPPGPSYLSERLLYLPSFGAALAVAGAAVLLKGTLPVFAPKTGGVPILRKSLGRLVAVVTGLYIAALGAGVILRLPVWRNELSLHKTMARENPGNATAHANLGRVLKDAGDLRGSIQAYSRAVELEPNSPDSHYWLADVLKSSGDTTGAEYELRQAIGLGLKRADAHTMLGDLMVNRREMTGALREYAEARKLAPNDAMIHNNLGVVLEQLGDIASAEKELRQALDLNPRLGLAHNNLGELLMNRDELDSAMTHFQQVIADQPDYGLAHYNAGLVFQRTGRPPEAEREFRRALELMPDFTPARDALEQLGRPQYGKSEVRIRE